jgi:glutathione synthase/RimK-type ligase-like ATP-grasp enzyme
LRENILIVSGPGDLHAFAVAEGIHRKGGRVSIWHTGDFPNAAWESMQFEGAGMLMDLRAHNGTLPTSGIRTVWNRRVGGSFDLRALHPADRTFASGQCLDLRRSTIQLIGEEAFWVNPPMAQARAMLKPVQLRVAQQAGFQVPTTLCSNDPIQIRAFVRRMGGTVVFKQLALAGIWAEGDKRFAPYTTTIREEQLADDLRTSAAPAIFQQVVPRSYELRVTVIGNHVFTSRLDPPAAEEVKVDWRLAVLRGQSEKMKRDFLPPQVEESVRSYMRALNIVFACFDLIVTPDERYVFLECNEAGQFLFVEEETGEAILDAFVTLLMQATPEFPWQESASSLRLDDILATALQQSEEAKKVHVAVTRARFYEDASGESSNV